MSESIIMDEISSTPRTHPSGTAGIDAESHQDTPTEHFNVGTHSSQPQFQNLWWQFGTKILPIVLGSTTCCLIIAFNIITLLPRESFPELPFATGVCQVIVGVVQLIAVLSIAGWLTYKVCRQSFKEVSMHKTKLKKGLFHVAVGSFFCLTIAIIGSIVLIAADWVAHADPKTVFYHFSTLLFTLSLIPLLVLHLRYKQKTIAKHKTMNVHSDQQAQDTETNPERFPYIDSLLWRIIQFTCVTVYIQINFIEAKEPSACMCLQPTTTPRMSWGTRATFCTSTRATSSPRSWPFWCRPWASYLSTPLKTSLGT
jgi:membrane protein YdbS with pleckstrin-like domain